MLAKTATLELTPAQAETVAKAQSMGQVSLSLRPLAEDVAMDAAAPPGAAHDGLSDGFVGPASRGPQVNVIRYGIAARAAKEDGQQNNQKWAQ